LYGIRFVFPYNAVTAIAFEWGVDAMKRAVLYLRVSTIDQTTANQERELREIASRSGLDIVKVYKDHGQLRMKVAA